MQPTTSIRTSLLAVAAGLVLAVSAPRAFAQSTTQPASQQDNPFPGDSEKPAASPSPQAPGQSHAKPSPSQTTPAKPATDNDNPFPGDLPAAAPGSTGIPVDSIPPSDSNPGSNSGAATRRAIDPDGDPVGSPDGAASTSDDGFSSSRAGVSHIPAEDDVDARPGKSIKAKTREQIIKDDLDVGSFYLGLKNWKGAQLRFSAAFALDAENPGAVWGLAEAERHLNLTKEASEHYQLFLAYDPDGPHSREARKALDQLESMPRSPSASKTPTEAIAPK